MVFTHTSSSILLSWNPSILRILLLEKFATFTSGLLRISAISILADPLPVSMLSMRTSMRMMPRMERVAMCHGVCSMYSGVGV